MGDISNIYSFIPKNEVKKPLGRPRCRWKDSVIKMDFKYGEDMDWI
jgi:hypothetical protein